jgi:hypothetical protein
MWIYADYNLAKSSWALKARKGRCRKIKNTF